MRLDSSHTVQLCRKYFTGKDAITNCFLALFFLCLGAPLVIPLVGLVVVFDVVLLTASHFPQIISFAVKLHVMPIVWPVKKLHQWISGKKEKERLDREQLANERRLKIERTAEQKRDDIRMRCQLLYDRHAVELTERFPRSQFWSYMETYLSHAQPLAIVERRGALLIEMIKECLVDVGKPLFDPSQEPETLGDVAEFFEEQRRQLKALNYDEDTLASMIASVNAEEDKAIAEFMSKSRKRRRG